MSSGIEPIVGLEAVRRVRGLDGQQSGFQVTDYAYAQWRTRQSSQLGLPPTFVMADRLTPRDHLLMQAALHPFIDSGIAKTVTLAREAPSSSVDELFRTAHVLGLKGCTVFRSSVRPSVIERRSDLEAIWMHAARDAC